MLQHHETRNTFTSLQGALTFLKRNDPELLKTLDEKKIPLEQYFFNVKTKRDPFNKYGTSIISKKPTEWNPKINKYNRILESEKETYRKLFSERMKRIHKTDNLLTDPEMQKKMLANRSISGTYVYSDGTKFTYTGSYEEDFIKFMDSVIGWDASDILMPAPFEVNYLNPKTGKMSFFIPDVLVTSLNLLIEIKASDNNHYRKRDIDIEFAKDDAVKEQLSSGTQKYQYLKIFDKNYDELRLILNNARSFN